MFSLAAGHFQRDDPSRTAIWKPDNWTNSWKVEQEEEEEDNLSPPSTSSTSSSILIPSQSCELAGLLCPRWPVVNPGVQQQATPWLRRVGTSKNGPHSNSASQAGGVHAVRCVCHYNRVLTNQPRRCVLGRGRRVVCSSNLAIVWTVSLSDDDDSLVLFRGSSHTNESLRGGGWKKRKIRIASR